MMYVSSGSGGCALAAHCAGSSAQTGHALFPSSPHRMSQMHTGVFSSSGGCASAAHCAESSAQTGHALFPSSPHRMSQMHTGVFSSSGGCASAAHCAGSSAQTGHALFPSSPHRTSQMHDVSSNGSAAHTPTIFVLSSTAHSATLMTRRKPPRRWVWPRAKRFPLSIFFLRYIKIASSCLMPFPDQ